MANISKKVITYPKSFVSFGSLIKQELRFMDKLEAFRWMQCFLLINSFDTCIFGKWRIFQHNSHADSELWRLTISGAEIERPGPGCEPFAGFSGAAWRIITSVSTLNCFYRTFPSTVNLWIFELKTNKRSITLTKSGSKSERALSTRSTPPCSHYSVLLLKDKHDSSIWVFSTVLLCLVFVLRGKQLFSHVSCHLL